MTQEYTPVAWQDETTSQQGTLINAERLNQMQQAHHYADGFEEVDTVPTANPGVSYHKFVYCTADSTFYRWDGTEWTADIDDETKRLLEQEIARATEAEGELAQDLADETARATARETALDGAITAEETAREQADTALGTRITNETSARETADTGLGNRITAEATARADADTALGGRIDTEQARAEAAEQANAQAIANTYTKAEIDTALGAKADVATTYTKTETDALLALKADQATTYTKAETDTLLASKANDNAVVHTTGDETVQGVKTLYSAEQTRLQIKSARTGATQPIGGVQFQNSTGTPVSFFYARVNGETGVQLLGSTKAFFVLDQRAYNPANTDDVATIGTLDAYTPMVRTTGNQGKSGNMTFYDLVRLEGDNQYLTQLLLINKKIEKTDRTQRQECSLYFQGKDNQNLGAIIYAKYPNGEKHLIARLFDDSGGYHDTDLASWSGDI